MAAPPPGIAPRALFGLRAPAGACGDALQHGEDGGPVYLAGHTLVVQSADGRAQRLLPGTPECECATAFAVAPNKKLVAVAERGDKARRWRRRRRMGGRRRAWGAGSGAHREWRAPHMLDLTHRQPLTLPPPHTHTHTQALISVYDLQTLKRRKVLQAPEANAQVGPPCAARAHAPRHACLIQRAARRQRSSATRT